MGLGLQFRPLLFHTQHMHTRHLVHGTSTTCVTPLAPVSLYNPPHGERTLLATLATCRFDNSSSEIFPGDVSGCEKTYTLILNPQLIEYALLFKDRRHCLLPLFVHAFYYVLDPL